MKIKKNWWLWLLISLCFFIVWVCRDSFLTYNLKVEKAKSKYEVEMKRVPGTIDKSISKPTPKEPIDVWGWVLKIGGALSVLKTILDIIDKFKSKSIVKLAKE